MRNAMRAAAVTLMQGYAAEANVALQSYPGRPRSLHVPAGFVDAINEPAIAYDGLRTRTPQAVCVFIWDLFDSAEAASQADDFIDGFIDWVTDHPSAAGAGTLIEVRSTEDDPEYTPEWMQNEGAPLKTYYATRVVLEGVSLDAN